ncbi:surface antigen BspA-like [Trichomonas vaginalis G3]|uniref:Surface antigen BspA-like n=1 Tax=Trichomonas vaginalis (strain ATCC PRA-98 / G3) TaxID=412133 RepID=A2G2Y4_TRIV3|nr:BspA type Leucine rich repeat region (6 copies) family [Trichomonas vaginalis G3]EAX88482.1 surface antigen BspA-like [Trichomonas vaginalis G3]KAI5531110.1 BspA type Leucine rich repeat region (6 copies) family [Trichomonas vaginalis G3]|eukprot:XP_001301412.1 surface antigen BspA-like [Trichomonas vaginalis G3]
MIVEIQDNAFENTILNSEISFPETITKIGSSSFKNCKFIPSIRFESSFSTNKGMKEFHRLFHSVSQLTISNNAFQDCISIREIVIYRDSYITFGENTFSGLVSLNHIEVRENIISIGIGCFMNSGLSSVQFQNNQICNGILPAFVFSGCSNLSSIDIPSNCITIDSSSLQGTSIRSVALPNSVSTLGDQCFKDCSYLVSLNINNESSLSRIGYGVFEGCIRFSEVSSFSSTNFVFDSGAIYSRDRHHMHVYYRSVFFPSERGISNPSPIVLPVSVFNIKSKIFLKIKISRNFSNFFFFDFNNSK